MLGSMQDPLRLARERVAAAQAAGGSRPEQQLALAEEAFRALDAAHVDVDTPAARDVFGLRAQANLALAQAQQRSGDLKAAAATLDLVFDAGREASDLDGVEPPWLALAHHRLGVLCDAVHDLPGAIAACRRALELYERQGDAAGAARVQNSLGIVYSRSGDQERARRRFDASLAHAREVGDVERQTRALSNLSICLRLLGRADEAVEAADASIELCTATGLGIAAATTNRALALADAGRRGEAAAAFDRATHLHEAEAERLDLAEHLRCLGEFHLAADELDDAESPLRRSLELAEAIGADGLLQAAHGQLANLCRRRGDFERALSHFEAFHRLSLASERATALRDLASQKWQAELELERRERDVMAARYDRLVGERDDLAGRAATLERDVLRDDLTGLANRRAFDAHLPHVVAVARRLGRPAGLALFDLDRFKQVNDGHGHAAGDDVLRAVALALAATTRSSDVLARIGGEEFALLMPDTDRHHAAAVAEKSRIVVEAMRWAVGGQTLRITISAGVVATDEVTGAPRTLVELADRRLYRAKRDGRNRVVANEGAEPGPTPRP